MPQNIRMWEVTPQNTLNEITGSKINLEAQLEDWLESDISMLDPDLLVIGRQVRTDFGGEIDLLCLDSTGALVVVELKKGKTPREVTAQALDYASWVKDLSFERIVEITSSHPKINGSLEDAFAAKFGGEELPDTLNLSHRSLIVAESMDSSTERIVQYLSDLNVPINVATVQHFKDGQGRELLAQVYLIEPEVAEVKAHHASKGRPYTSVSHLQEKADKNGIGGLYRQIRNGVMGILSTSTYTNTVSYCLGIGGGSVRTVLFVRTAPCDENGGVGYTLHATRFNKYLGVSVEDLKALLPQDAQETDVSGWVGSSPEEKEYALGLNGCFHTPEEVDTFLDGLRAAHNRTEAALL